MRLGANGTRSQWGYGGLGAYEADGATGLWGYEPMSLGAYEARSL